MAACKADGEASAALKAAMAPASGVLINEEFMAELKAARASLRKARTCLGCGVSQADHRGLKTCKGCHRAYLCSRACSASSWERHKEECRAVARESEEAAAREAEEPEAAAAESDAEGGSEAGANMKKVLKDRKKEEKRLQKAKEKEEK